MEEEEEEVSVTGTGYTLMWVCGYALGAPGYPFLVVVPVVPTTRDTPSGCTGVSPIKPVVCMTNGDGDLRVVCGPLVLISVCVVCHVGS